MNQPKKNKNGAEKMKKNPESAAMRASLALMRQVMVAMHDVQQAQAKLDKSLQHLYGLFESVAKDEPRKKH